MFRRSLGDGSTIYASDIGWTRAGQGRYHNELARHFINILRLPFLYVKSIWPLWTNKWQARLLMGLLRLVEVRTGRDELDVVWT